MNVFSAWLIPHLLITGGLGLIVALICKVARPSPAARHALWLLVLCRLMIPPIGTWPWALPSWESTEAFEQADTSSHRKAANTPSAQLLSQVDGQLADNETDVSVIDAVMVVREPHTHDEVASPVAVQADDASTQSQFEWTLGGLWLLGSVIVLVVIMRRMRKVHGLLRDSERTVGWLADDIAAWCDRLNVRCPDCVVTERVASPFLWCLGHVRLAWPQSESLAERREALQSVLVHELAHLKRRDHWTAWIEFVATVTWWWNPLFWLVRRELRNASEEACDAIVVELLPDHRRTFAESLIEFTNRQQTPQLAVGAASGSHRTFARRLEMIMSGQVRTRLSKWTIACALILACVSLPTFATQGEPDAKQVEQEQASKTVRTTSKAEKTVQKKGTQKVELKSKVTTQIRQLRPDSVLSTAPKSKTSASLAEVLKRIETNYYGNVDRQELEQAAIDAILGKLDSYSSIITPDELEKMTVMIDGELVGVGIAIHIDGDTKQATVTRPIRHSPALAAGVQKGDVILKVDGKSTAGLKLYDLVKLIRGPQGSSVTLGLKRGDRELDIQVVRKRFEVSLLNPWSVLADGTENYWADDKAKIGYAHIPSFTRQTASQLRKVLAGLHKDGMQALVLDLRNCGGGLLSAATDVANMFIDEGVIVSSQGRSDHENLTIRAKSGGEFLELPVAVLINEYTASAAEIVAACLQDHHRASMVGEQSFGKGTVQSLFPLQDGGALKLTTAAWLRPNGRTLLRREGSKDWGVRPDAGLRVEIDDKLREKLLAQQANRWNGESIDEPIADPQLGKALAFLKLK